MNQTLCSNTFLCLQGVMRSLSVFARGIIQIIGSLAVIGIVTPHTLAVFAPVMCLFYWIYKYYQASNREVCRALLWLGFLHNPGGVHQYDMLFSRVSMDSVSSKASRYGQSCPHPPFCPLLCAYSVHVHLKMARL